MSRNLDFRSEEFRPYAQALGELALVWYDLHMSLCSLFATISKISNRLAPYTIWNSLTSDRAQRNMLLAFVNMNALGFRIPSNLRTELNWLIEEVGKLEDLRNDAIHSPTIVTEDGAVSPWFQLGHVRAKKFKGKNLLRELRRFYDTAILLREFSEKLECALNSPRDPLPARPTLPNLGHNR